MRFFETSTLNYEAAKNNCKEKLQRVGLKGQLFEPKTKAMNDKVMGIAKGFKDRAWYWIGVTDSETEGTYKYNSDSTQINFSPKWHPGYGSKGTTQNCIMIYSGASYPGDWIDYTCSDMYRHSVCMAVV